MMTKIGNQQIEMHLITIEDLVPTDHFLRKVNAIIDFSFIYDEVENMYCHNNGRPSIGPAVLIKFLLIGFLYGINSERRISEEIQVNMAYRWFLGLDIMDKVPDHSTISQNRRRRFNGSDLFRNIFQKIVFLCVEKGLADGRLVFTDSTHIKANASRKTEYIKQTEEVTNEYLKELDQYEETVRSQLESEGKIKPARCRKRKEKIETVRRRVSSTDPESGYYKRKGKAEGMHYLSHETVDSKNGITIDVAATAGNVNGSQPYIERLDYIGETIGLKIQAACADSGYDTNLINQQLPERNIDFYTPKRTEQKRGTTEFQRKDFQYDEKDDRFICPGGKALPLHRLNRTMNTVTKEYRCPKTECKDCPFRNRCIGEKGSDKRIQVNIFEDVVKKNHEKDGTETHAKVLLLRQIWSEGSFAAQKARHNLKFLYRRGLEAAEQQCLLSSTALNLKRMIKVMA
ncbi:IS1182 family transposase [Lachnospiraceae bacterium JLR.KK009]|nr:hypothetical protein C810_02600 [Lachnospiraceae bacterium A2]EOS45752.1 hypothetical protein C810_02422 [Lachnospiraceae bacterium A2]